MTLEDFVNYFQILHAEAAPCFNQCKHEVKQKKQEEKEANHEKDATYKRNGARKQENAGSSYQPNKQSWWEKNLCCFQNKVGYNFVAIITGFILIKGNLPKQQVIVLVTNNVNAKTAADMIVLAWLTQQ